MKKELNEKFKKLHPEVHPSLTLSQIHNLKGNLLHIGLEVGLELSTIARGYVLLEKLILRGLVAKTNRKVIGACCLMLSSKATDLKTVDYLRLMTSISATLSVSRKQVIDLEFSVLAALSFRLQIPDIEFGGHLLRLLTSLDFSNLQEYLGERMYDHWQGISSYL